jgi:hypothetical protein
MRNQWRVGMAGMTGLDMNVFDLYCRRLRVPEHEQDEVFQALLVMEHAALKFFDSKRPKA